MIPTMLDVCHSLVCIAVGATIAEYPSLGAALNTTPLPDATIYIGLRASYVSVDGRWVPMAPADRRSS